MNLLIKLIIILIIFYIIKKNEIENFLEYAKEEDDYIFPTIHENVICEEEAKYIIEKAEVIFKDSETVSGLDTNIRKSQTAWLYVDDIKIKKIIERICKLTNMPLENAEALQIVKYVPGGFYRQHHDSCCDNNNECDEFIKRGGQRSRTMVIYLNDDFTGGFTKFPIIKQKYKPPKYGGLLFHPLEKKGDKCHPYALHEGTDLESGVKYIANVWIRQYKFV